ncbi:hypothetical protein [Dendronalium sp. ChiSLP03b]|nr:hypothetical protein [Dendronalium sp. ChiSLP03b]MDZ8207110.1 hypothetical protein [Dendronalium sp. ChiSLP03b]
MNYFSRSTYTDVINYVKTIALPMFSQDTSVFSIGTYMGVTKAGANCT